MITSFCLVALSFVLKLNYNCVLSTSAAMHSEHEKKKQKRDKKPVENSHSNGERS